MKPSIISDNAKKFFQISLLISMSLLCTSCGWSNVSVHQIFINLQQSLGPIWQFLTVLSWVIGIWFVGFSIFKLKKYGQQMSYMSSQASIAEPLAFLIVGCGLIYLPSLLDTMNMTIWSYGVEDIQAYSDPGRFGSGVIGPLLQLVQVLGLVSFIRGWIAMAKVGSGQAQPGTMAKGVMHMVGGVLAINIYGTMDVLGTTFFG